MKKVLSVLPVVLWLVGCASVVPKGQVPDPDPFEYTNRKIFTLNKNIDKAVLKPLAQGYRAVTTPGIRQSVRNVYANIHEIPNLLNDVLQINPKEACYDVARFGVNTTVGLLGLFDVSSKMGMARHYNTFGKTLSYWGMSYSPYLVLPIFGPSTVRDAAGGYIDSYYDPIQNNMNAYWRIGYYGLQGISVRETLLDSDEVRSVMSLDEYVFVRNAYLQKHGMVIPEFASSNEIDEFDAPASKK